MNNEDINADEDIILSGKNGNGFKLVLSHKEPHLGGNYLGTYNYNNKEYKGDGNSITVEMWDFLIKKFKIKTVLDIGCGCGYSSEIFRDLGCDVKCFDGLEYNIKNSDSSLKCFVHDLTKSSYISKEKFDLVWCCEVAEHIEEKYISNFIETLKNGNIIAMTAAQLGDGGHHHVNLQNKDYWIKKVEEDGEYGYDYFLTEHCKQISIPPDPRWESHFKRNGLIFLKK